MPEDGRIWLQPSPVQFSWHDWPKGRTRLMVAPRWKRKAWLNGVNVIRTADVHGLREDAYVCWQNGEKWVFASVSEADDRNLRLEFTGTLPLRGTPIHEARPLDGPNLPAKAKHIGLLDEELADAAIDDVTASSLAEHESPAFPNIVSTGPGAPDPLAPIPSIFGKLPEVGSFIVPTPLLPIDLVKAAVKLLLKTGAMVIPSTGEPVFEFIEPGDLADQIFELVATSDSVNWENADADAVKTAIENALTLPDGSEPVFFKRVKEAFLEKAPFLVVPEEPPVKAIVARSEPKYVFDGDPGRIESGDWVVADFKDGLRALRVLSITNLSGGESREAFGLGFDGLVGNEGELETVFGEFRDEFEPADGKVNTAEIQFPDIELEKTPDGLERGRKILLTAEGCPPVEATITAIDGTTITTDVPANDCFDKGNLIIRGNVVAAGHGATKPAKRLSSGEASSGFQSLSLDVEYVSSIPDATFPRGVRADIEVAVENMIWTQVPDLHGSSPTDPHYAVLASEDGTLRLVFGDGVRGRRLPSGSNNVRVRYRVGAGRSGNLSPGSLAKPVKPHRIVASVQQPAVSAGGEEMEATAQIRENAPATMLALERAVSLVDFENLTASRVDVWQARAVYRPSAGTYLDRVTVVVVPSGGVELNEVLRREIGAFLREHAVPTVSVDVIGFTRQEVRLDVTIRVDTSRYDTEEALRKVRAALVTGLRIEQRRIGEPMFLSEIYRIVENVEEVSDSRCAFRGQSGRYVRPRNWHEVVFLTDEPADLAIDSEAYLP